MSKVYEHYFKNGSTEFDINKFEDVENDIFGSKPRKGGFWGSPKDSDWGWKQWCESECEEQWIANGKIEFRLRPFARVLEVKTPEDVKNLPHCFSGSVFLLNEDGAIDFEQLAKDYDAIEVHFGHGLYWDLYGWDCDSILVLHPDVIDII